MPPFYSVFSEQDLKCFRCSKTGSSEETQCVLDLLCCPLNLCSREKQNVLEREYKSVYWFPFTTLRGWGYCYETVSVLGFSVYCGAINTRRTSWHNSPESFLSSEESLKNENICTSKFDEWGRRRGKLSVFIVSACVKYLWWREFGTLSSSQNIDLIFVLTAEASPDRSISLM